MFTRLTIIGPRDLNSIEEMFYGIQHILPGTWFLASSECYVHHIEELTQ
jgi:hypothetical protein